MGINKRLIQLFMVVVVVVVASNAATPAASQAKPGCPETCGNLTIPYPFGTTESCYHDESFLITCNSSKPYLRKSNIDVLNISLDGELRVPSWIGFDCYNESGALEKHFDPWFSVSQFPISYTRNKFTAVGCDTYAFVQGSVGRKYATGCTSLCSNISDVVNGSCSGIGCCQTLIPKGVKEFELLVKSYYNHSEIWNFNPCSYAFVVEDGIYTFASEDLYNLINTDKLPVVLDWAVGNKTCQEARKEVSTYTCGNNTSCYDSDNGPGYRCNCSQGYQGNPYLPNSCKDIDECSTPGLNLCTYICHNTDGNYTCSCPKWYHGDGRKDGLGCISDQIWSKVIVGITSSLLFLSAIVAFVYWVKQKRKSTKVREDCFKQNGGVMLQKLLSNGENSDQVAKIFTEAELKKATKNFNEMCVIGQGGFGTVYKGTLADNRVVAIKKSKLVDRDQINQFVTEVKILSQIDHPNVVKLLGCCLETSVPLLVYEFINNNALFYHLHDEACVSSIPWESRLRIATETAEALAHIHSTTQIIHRDIKSANILLNDDYTAKVSDFGISKFVPSGKTHLTTLVQGTFGYIDPEYFHSGNLTEKSDVYSFGVVLVELLSGKMVVSFERLEKNRSLAAYFVSSMEEDLLFQILEDRVKREGDVEQLKGVAEVAKKCLELKGDRRPSMKEVKEELKALRNFEKHSRPDQIGSHIEEGESLLFEPLDFYGNSASTVFDSAKNQVIFQMDSGGR